MFFSYTDFNSEFKRTSTIYYFVCILQIQTLGSTKQTQRIRMNPETFQVNFSFLFYLCGIVADMPTHCSFPCSNKRKTGLRMLAAPNKYLCVDVLHVEKYSGFGLLKYGPFTSPYKCAAPYKARGSTPIFTELTRCEGWKQKYDVAMMMIPLSA